MGPSAPPAYPADVSNPASAASHGLTALALPSVAAGQLHIPKLIDRFDLAAYRTLAHIAVGETVGLLLHLLDKLMRLRRLQCLMCHARKTLIQGADGILPEVEAVQPKEAVAVAFEHLLPLHIVRLHVKAVIRRIDLIELREMFFEPVILDDDGNTLVRPTNLDQKINLIIWVLVGRIQLP